MAADQATRVGGRRLSGELRNGDEGRPLVSVVTAVFNGGAQIQHCIDSIAAQDYDNVEHIVIDGGSTDNTVDVLRANDKTLALWRSERDRGVYDAWNKALAEARGEWICFVGADDEYLPGAIRGYMELAAAHPDAEFLSSQERWVHASGYERIRGGPWSWESFSRWNCIAHVGSMHRRTLFARLGTYDLRFGTAADYELLLRAGPALRTAYVPQISVLMRGGGMTDRRAAMADATRAKVLTGGRNPILAKAELYIAYAKYPLRPLRRALGTLLG